MLTTGQFNVDSVGIRPSSSILSVLHHLNYKPWYAIAEFVDNSIESYATNRDALRSLHGPDFKLNIKIRLDLENKLIEVTDNAAGISAQDYPRAFRAAEVPPTRSGLSEFGMGMKTAACWFSHTWTVRSKALGETVERLVRFDLEAVVHEKLDSLPVIAVPCTRTEHFTVVRLEKVGRKFPVTRTQKKLRDHLTSMYRVFLQRGDITIRVDDELLCFKGPDVLVAPSCQGAPDEMVTWRQPIDIELSGERRVHGFAAIRREASTTHAGFALFRRNRLILGSDDETYRPPEIFGNSNSFRYQRLFGELHLEGFDVSHTKDGFHWHDVEEEMLQKLRDSMREGDNFLRQADNYRARPSKVGIEPMLARAGSSMVMDLSKGAGAALSVSEEHVVPGPALPDYVPQPDHLAGSTNFSILVDGQQWNVLVRASVDPTLQEWLRISRVDNTQLEGMVVREIMLDVSMAHPFVQSYIGPRNENAELFLRFAVGLGLAAEKSGRAGYPVSVAMHWFNRLLREALAGEQT